MKTKLIDKLLQSINPAQKEIDKLWAKECERRIKEIKSGFNSIPTDNLSNGVYIFKIYSEKGSVTKKLIKY